jgi:hypothetical protein
MNNIILMVHNDFSEKLLKGALAHIQGVKINVITPKMQRAAKILENPVLNILETIKDQALINSQISMVIVESNYGHPASSDINSSLLKELKIQFPKAKLIAYSGTSASLVKALEFDQTLAVLPKDNFENAQNAIMAQLVTEKDHAEYRTRILSMKELKAKIQNCSDAEISPNSSPKMKFSPS